MSEINSIYIVNGECNSLESFKKNKCALNIEDPDFEPPTPEQVKNLRELMGFSQVDLAKLTGVSWNADKGSGAVRKWETKEGKEKRSISKAAWQLMLIKSGLVTVEPL
jgi:DNA-binding transcriptional regulator YiaG